MACVEMVRWYGMFRSQTFDRRWKVLRQHVVALEHERAALAKKCISLEVELHAAHSEQARASRASSTVFTEGPRYPAYALVPTG